jgi:hypothetical protein
MSTGKVRKNVDLSAVVFPPCVECKAPYKPTKPILDYGTVFFESPDAIATFWFRIEQFFRDLRIARLRKL